jgi:hypothetical protein
MESNQFPWARYEENIRAAESLWTNFPRKDLLNQQHVFNIDLLFFLLHDTLRRNDRGQAAENQLQMLLRSCLVAFRQLVA